MTEKIDHLIAELSREPKPARKAHRPMLSFAIWFVGACAYVAMLVAVQFHPRPDLAVKLMQPLFLAEFATLILLAAAASLGATLLSFPDMYQQRWVGYMPAVLLLIFVGILLLEWLADQPPAPNAGHGMECCTAMTLAAIAPALWMFSRIRNMAPVHPRLAGSCALLSSFSIGALILRISEPTDSMTHLIVWHYAPMLGFAAFGLWLGHKIFKW